MRTCKTPFSKYETPMALKDACCTFDLTSS